MPTKRFTDLTQKEVVDLFNYDPETGLLSRKSWINGCSNDSEFVTRPVVNGKRYLASRLIWLHQYGEWPIESVDHIDGNTSNNRLENLRSVTQFENMLNRKLSKKNKSGVPDVQFRKDRGMWQVAITAENRHIHLGQFADFFEAVCARKSAERKYGYHLNNGMR